MKHSVRYIEIKYDGLARGKSILFLRGMEVREWAYTVANVSRIFDATHNRREWEFNNSAVNFKFTRIYKDS